MSVQIRFSHQMGLVKVRLFVHSMNFLKLSLFKLFGFDKGLQKRIIERTSVGLIIGFFQSPPILNFGTYKPTRSQRALQQVVFYTVYIYVICGIHTGTFCFKSCALSASSDKTVSLRVSWTSILVCCSIEINHHFIILSIQLFKNALILVFMIL